MSYRLPSRWIRQRLSFLFEKESKVTLVGEDDEGRKYYEKNTPGSIKPARRYYETYVVKDPFEIIEKPVPPEWNQWLRFTRKDPPQSKKLENKK